VWRGSGARSAFPTLSRASLSLPPAMPCFARTAPSRRRPSISVYALERSSALPASKGVRRTSMLDRREREHAPVSPRPDDTHRRHARPYALHRPSVCCRRRRLGQPRPRDRRLRRPGCAYVSLCGCAILRRMRGSSLHRRLSLSYRARSVRPTASRSGLLRRCVSLCSTSTSAHGSAHSFHSGRTRSSTPPPTSGPRPSTSSTRWMRRCQASAPSLSLATAREEPASLARLRITPRALRTRDSALLSARRRSSSSVSAASVRTKDETEMIEQTTYASSRSAFGRRILDQSIVPGRHRPAASRRGTPRPLKHKNRSLIWILAVELRGRW
jgi:hypothetical protein